MTKMKIEINFNFELCIEFYDNALADLFVKQHKTLKNLHSNNYWPRFDNNVYTIKYLEDLITKANKEILNWNYSIKPGIENYKQNQLIFNQMHKTIEEIAKNNTLHNYNQRQQSLLHEIHCAIHGIEYPDAVYDKSFNGRGCINAGYFHGSSDKLEKMPNDIKFSRTLHQGEMFLDYPYVGKEPFYCMLHEDNSNLLQTCKIIDRVSLSWLLYLQPKTVTNFLTNHNVDNIDANLTEWYKNHQTTLEKLNYSLDDVLNHTGFAKIGKITNINDCEYLANTRYLNINAYEIID